MLDPAVGLTATLAYADSCAEALCKSPEGDATINLLLGFMLECVRFGLMRARAARAGVRSVVGRCASTWLRAPRPLPCRHMHNSDARRPPLSSC